MYENPCFSQLRKTLYVVTERSLICLSDKKNFYCYSCLNIIILFRNIYRRIGIELGLNHAHYVLAFTVQLGMDH